ncbi:CobW family GTP-binding protein [Nocardia stercoris]|uniref:GTP-binding protein n=1 Tax=Nocardia stercoris TaxID=2483361 RepID=A0A3M2LE42_9NOCA|nr:CobW family GTP-binding protein [Nocardia stercoris]RMI35817.1 GTP-binding protein [Nocardia stercoris]
MPQRIPVLIVAGFLGAGKTTLLNHLLRHREARIGVVVNDFGAIGIDALLVAGQVDAMVSLGNGCVCCAVDLTELDEMFARLTEPRHRIDLIVVEGSGLAEPANLIRMVLGSANPRLRYGGLVEVVDAEHFDETRARHPELDAHLGLADLVVLNKADRVAGPELARLRSVIGEVVGAVPVYPTAYGRVDPRLLFDPVAPAAEPVAVQLGFDDLLLTDDDAHEDGAGHAHLHDGYRSVSFRSSADLDPRRLVEVLAPPPAGVYRAKGHAAFAVRGERRKFVMHLVGRHLVFEPAGWSRGESRESALVFIGTGLDADELVTRLEDTRHGGEPLDDSALLPVWRFVPRTPD